MKAYVSPNKNIVDKVEIDRDFVVVTTNLWGKPVCSTIITGIKPTAHAR
jgi:hypothetical protein